MPQGPLVGPVEHEVAVGLDDGPRTWVAVGAAVPECALARVHHQVAVGLDHQPRPRVAVGPGLEAHAGAVGVDDGVAVGLHDQAVPAGDELFAWTQLLPRLQRGPLGRVGRSTGEEDQRGGAQHDQDSGADSTGQGAGNPALHQGTAGVMGRFGGHRRHLPQREPRDDDSPICRCLAVRT